MQPDCNIAYLSAIIGMDYDFVNWRKDELSSASMIRFDEIKRGYEVTNAADQKYLSGKGERPDVEVYADLPVDGISLELLDQEIYNSRAYYNDKRSDAIVAHPIINENDTVNTDEISVGDNDTLGAIVAVSMHADLLVMLSDIDGLYTADPHKDENAELISVVKEITPEIEALGGGKGSSLGTGGMVTKLNAAKLCMSKGTDMVIANGSNPSVLYDIVDGEKIGTKFIAK